MQELVEAIRNRKAILFAGAGLSMNLGLPSYGSLISRLAQELDFDPQLFQLSGDYLSLAEYYYQVKGKLGPLRSWMDTTWHANSIDISKSFLHRAIVELKFPSIYTTNYDRWIERAFEHWNVPFSKITNVSDIALAKEDRTQIIKFHGDFDDDDSIVLTESSYFDRMSFESPLDIKLRGDVLGKSVLFLGYSLSDINMRYLLYRLHKQWELEGFQKARPKSYIFLTRPNIVQEGILRSRGIVPIVAESDNPMDSVKTFLLDLLKEAYGKTIEEP
ncbi:SIR2 family protein [Noviherbaspirillum suwonense]|uniref:SIR2-like domain-containing protein n=1 Tax=Noviherbaspirillum suwonense TaxID=1224511 RepID=A0ABY1Q1I7_9BURK|nr:SIR2 family protein [Noviherbaspirillum suwonense]SMP52291.1 SIR2-like domain-containing protein [Noviherbaspirillum suwonense]